MQIQPIHFAIQKFETDQAFAHFLYILIRPTKNQNLKPKTRTISTDFLRDFSDAACS